jgi:hypothetical protein
MRLVPGFTKRQQRPLSRRKMKRVKPCRRPNARVGIKSQPTVDVEGFVRRVVDGRVAVKAVEWSPIAFGRDDVPLVLGGDVFKYLVSRLLNFLTRY